MPLPAAIRQADSLKDVSQCIAVLLRPILVTVSFISLYSKHKCLHSDSHDSCFTLMSYSSRWWRCQGAAENCHVYYTFSAQSSSSVPAGSGSQGTRCQLGYSKHVVSWPCSWLALHTLAFDCKKRFCIYRSACWTNISNLLQVEFIHSKDESGKNEHC